MIDSRKVAHIKWNKDVKMIIADVDETIADVYTAAEPEMITELVSLLEEGISLFFVTGQSVKSVQWRISDKVPQHLRSHILVGHCSGTEVWGHDKDGNLREKPFYSVYEKALSQVQKKQFRVLIEQLIAEFKLKTYETMPKKKFLEKIGDDPLAVMYEDRGPQITLEVMNGVDLTPEKVEQLEVEIPETHGCYDLRIPIIERADDLFEQYQLPITPRLAGTVAIDFTVKGISKTTSVKHVLEDDTILDSLNLNQDIFKSPKSIEIWGDKFSVIRGGTDRHMSEALPKKFRSIDFREEDPTEFLEGYNIVVWNGQKHLHHGTLEYLQGRHN